MLSLVCGAAYLNGLTTLFFSMLSLVCGSAYLNGLTTLFFSMLSLVCGAAYLNGLTTPFLFDVEFSLWCCLLKWSHYSFSFRC